MTSDTSTKSAGCTVSKFWLYFINSGYLLLGLIIIGVAAAAKAQALLTNLTILGGVIAMGVFLVALSILGLVATSRSSQILLFLYIVFMSLLFIVQFSVGLAAVATPQTRQKDLLAKGWCHLSPQDKGWFQYSYDCYAFNTNDTASGDPMDCMAPPAESADYQACPSQCRVTVEPNCLSDPPPPPGSPPCGTCYDLVKDRTNVLLKRGGGVCLGFAFLEFVGIWAATRYRRESKTPATYNAFL